MSLNIEKCVVVTAESGLLTIRGEAVGGVVKEIVITKHSPYPDMLRLTQEEAWKLNSLFHEFVVQLEGNAVFWSMEGEE